MPSSHHAVNTISVIKTNQLMLYMAKVIFFLSYIQNINIFCEQNIEFLNVKPDGTYSNS